MFVGRSGGSTATRPFEVSLGRLGFSSEGEEKGQGMTRVSVLHNVTNVHLCTMCQSAHLR